MVPLPGLVLGSQGHKESATASTATTTTTTTSSTTTTTITTTDSWSHGDSSRGTVAELFGSDRCNRRSSFLKTWSRPLRMLFSCCSIWLLIRFATQVLAQQLCGC